MIDWSCCPEEMSWPEAELHLWRVDLHDAPDAPLAWLNLLSPDENVRANRFRFERDRRRFIHTRGLLRVLLGRYLDQPPESLRFEYGACGKPALAPGTSRQPLHFNLSHSREVALIAVTGVAEVGIDIEYIDYSQPVEEVAERFFTPAELAWLRSGEEHFQSQRFFQLWTRKEACLKARGTGLSGWEEPGESLLQVVNLEAGAGYAAAVALAGTLPPMKAWQWLEP